MSEQTRAWLAYSLPGSIVLKLPMGLILMALLLGWAGLGAVKPSEAATPLTWVEPAVDDKGMRADGGEVSCGGMPPGGRGVAESRMWVRGIGPQSTGTIDGVPVVAEGISADGRAMVGNANSRAALWREGGGWQWLPLPPDKNSAAAYAVSADGRVVVGVSGRVIGNVPLGTVPTLWEDGQVRELGLPPDRGPCVEASLTAISPGGDAAAGFLGPAGCGFVALLWTRYSGFVVLGIPSGYDATMATAVADGGRVVVGKLMRSDGSRFWTVGAFRWTPEGGMEQLAGGDAAALAVSRNGRICGGVAQFGDVRRAARWVDGQLRNLHDELAPFLQAGDVLASVNGISPDGRYVVGMGARGLERFAFVAEVPEPPEPPSLVAIWPIEGDPVHAMISWQPPAGVTRYRVESALDPTFSFGRSVMEFPAGPYNLLVVGTPGWDGGVFYYRIAACNAQACSGWSPTLATARRIWPGPEHWNMVSGGFRFLDRVYLWAQNATPVPGKASDLHLYEGLQGYGGQERRVCRAVMPGSSCRTDFPTASALASASQSFPPYGQVGIGFWVR